MTGYYFSCTEHFDDCLRLLLRMVMTPDFLRAAMASEREVIADEIALYADSPCRLRAGATAYWRSTAATPSAPFDHGHTHVHPPVTPEVLQAVL